MEFHYKDNLIKSLLKQIKNIDMECQNIQDITDIKYFISNKIKLKETKKIPFRYKERAKGEFQIKTQNKRLINLFQQIQKTIKNK